MSSECGDVLLSGSWTYDAEVVGRVRILKMKLESPNAPDLAACDEDLEDPPTDADGYYYVAEFSLPTMGASNNGSRSWGHATVEEAIRYAEEKLPSPVRWER